MRALRWSWALVLPGALLAAPTMAEPAPFAERTLAAALEQRLSAPSVLVAGTELDGDTLRALYDDRGYAPLWVSEADFDATFDDALDLFEAAEAEGLWPNDYYLVELADLADATTLEDYVAIELAMSGAVMRYGSDIHRGRLNPQSLPGEFDYDRRAMDLTAVAEGAAAASDLDAFLLALAPQHDYYQDLRGALADARAWVDRGGWPEVPVAGTVRPGESSSVVPAIRERLARTGHYDGEPGVGGNVLDEALVAAIEQFQEEHGLAVDGVVGPRTYAALNVTAEQRVNQIIAGMERWRWLPPDLGSEYILVNIPDYQLTIVSGGVPIRQMDIIVGRRDRQTPLFSSALSYLEFNPTWTVPTSIAVRDMLPHLLEDPSYLSRQNITLYSSWGADRVPVSPESVNWEEVGSGIRSYMLRQSPGPGNALGRVKFMMANNFAVYLHDTPSRSLFYRAHRTFSSGCVRVEDPMWLADYLLADRDGWSESYRQSILASGRTTRVDMPAPMPVHLAYVSVWVDDLGEVQYREDVYGVDRLIAEALNDHRPDRLEVALAD
jgi:murein L,D-transpeptidase YcbB/YkuD